MSARPALVAPDRRARARVRSTRVTPLVVCAGAVLSAACDVRPLHAPAGGAPAALRATLDAVPQPLRAGVGFRAYVIAHAEDCESNLAFTTALGRAGVRDRIFVDKILILGDTAVASRSFASRLAVARADGARLLPIPERATDAIAALGVRHTPALLVFDSTDALRYTVSGLVDLVQFVTVGRTLAQLAGDPLRRARSAASPPPPDASAADRSQEPRK